MAEERADFIWRMQPKHAIEFRRLMGELEKFERLGEEDAYMGVIEELKLLPGYPADMSPLDLCDIIIESPTVYSDLNPRKIITLPGKDGLIGHSQKA